MLALCASALSSFAHVAVHMMALYASALSDFAQLSFHLPFRLHVEWSRFLHRFPSCTLMEEGISSSQIEGKAAEHRYTCGRSVN